MDITQFQNDLQSGMTLENALTKHNISLAEAFTRLHYKVNQKTPNKRKRNIKRYNASQYIQARDGKYYLRKTVQTTKGRTTLLFGTYNTLEDAIRMREALKEDGWHQRHVDSICQRLHIERCKPKRKPTARYH